jgi:hypothetical protein
VAAVKRFGDLYTSVNGSRGQRGPVVAQNLSACAYIDLHDAPLPGVTDCIGYVLGTFGV